MPPTGGLAGGTPWPVDAAEEGRYVNTTHARHGMRGTDLPEMPTGTVWKAGGTAEVAWNVRALKPFSYVYCTLHVRALISLGCALQVRFNHGGGCKSRLYLPSTRLSFGWAAPSLTPCSDAVAPPDSYRLCPASEPLTEACFQSHPLDFVQDKQALVLQNGTKVPVGMHSVFTNVGTSPLGSWWARLPIPAGGLGPRCSCDMNVNYKPGDFKCGCRESTRPHYVRHSVSRFQRNLLKLRFDRAEAETFLVR